VNQITCVMVTVDQQRFMVPLEQIRIGL